MSIRKIYCAGAFTAPSEAEVRANIEAAKAVGLLVREAGFIPFVPHLAIVPSQSLTWDKAMEECLAYLSDCHGVLMFGDWHRSKGALAELHFADAHGIPVFFSLAELVAGLEARP